MHFYYKRFSLYFCFLLGALLILGACTKKHTLAYEVNYALKQSQGKNLYELPKKCIHTEWPNKLNQVLADANEMGTPSELHPVFFGCFDWHSSVHGHWTLLRLVRKFPSLDSLEEIKSLFDKTWTKENMEKEVAYFNRSSEKGFERPYGWAWLLKLSEELYIHGLQDSFWKEKFELLQPLSHHIIQKYLDFYPNLVYPVRSGEHTNAAFGLNLAWDYAQTTGNEKFISFIKSEALRLYKNDKNCPLDWEPSGYDFISHCLEEAYLMSKVMESSDFEIWLKGFLPQLFYEDFVLKAAEVKDREDGKLVHLDGYNYTAAKCLYGISKALPKLKHLIPVANTLVAMTLPKITDGHYAGEHWLASFAVLALTE